MKTQTMNKPNAADLRNEVEKWVNTFNFINVEVLEKMADGNLSEYIRTPEQDYEDFLDNYQLREPYEKWLSDKEEEDTEENRKDFCEAQNNFDDWRSEQEGENYPMWSTCFEFKHEEREEVLKAAEEAGFGIIEGLEPFNQILFVAGAGYSFYASHWIPLYLNLPWNTDKKELYKDLDYSMI